VSGYLTRNVRGASGFVLVGNSETMRLLAKIAIVLIDRVTASRTAKE